MSAIIVYEYGDFDMLFAKSVWLAPDNIPKDNIKLISDEITSLNGREQSCQKAEKELKSRGFKCLKTYNVKCGGEL